ncbi:MAG: OB-fold-containig protein [Pseudomonadota bacterium]
MTLLAEYNLPFLIALIALVLISVAQIVGLGDLFDSADADFEIDMDVDPDAIGDGAISSGWIEGAFSLLGLGKVPFLIWLMLLLFVFSIIGVSGQALALSLIGIPFDTLAAAGLAFAAALPINGALTRPLAKLLPQDETSAVGLDTLVRRDAQIQIGTARAGSPARSKVVDVFGHPHFVMVEPHDPTAEMREGDTVLLVRREGETFFAVHYESPALQLD